MSQPHRRTRSMGGRLLPAILLVCCILIQTLGTRQAVAGAVTSSDFPTANPYQGSLGTGGTSIVLARIANPTTPPSPTPVTMRLSYSYDNAGRRTAMTYPDGQQESWSYDPAGRVNQVTQPGVASHTWTVSHDGANNLTQLLAANGGKQTWSYDNAGRNTSTSWLAGSTTIFSQTATLDAAGQRTALADSAGATSYGYDLAGRLTNAAYPDGSTEADQYDPAGNRTVTTNTVGLTSTVTTNTLDAADQLNSASTRVNGGTPSVTSYTYDANGNQLGSSGATGIVTNTYNLQNQLVHVSGPATNSSYVYDGQGDRLRSYEQYPTVPVLHNEAQDLAGGLSSMVWDGSADYSYLTPGSGAAPLARYDQSTLRTTTLATDLLGSVRLATDPSNAVLGAGTYDAWGSYRANPGGSGATLLAGLQASSPFGFAGQQFDSGPGTYAMRARTYSPGQGRFQSQDPLAYTPTVPVTINPYEYAGNMPTGVTDPSGMGWARPTPKSDDAKYESSIANDLGLMPNGSYFANSSRTAFANPAIPPRKSCRTTFSVNLVLFDSPVNAGTAVTGRLWDMEHVQAFQGSPGPLVIARGIQTHLVDGASAGLSIGDQVVRANLRLGGDYLQAFNLRGTSVPVGAGTKVVRVIDEVEGSHVILAWSGGPGLILYDVLDKQPSNCPLGSGWFACMANVFVVSPYQVVRSDPNWLHKGFAAVGLISVVGGTASGLLRLGKLVGRARNAPGIAADAETLSDLGASGTNKAVHDISGAASSELAYIGDTFQRVVFRGTSEGFPGSTSLQRIGITPASTDPVVATIFATEAENYGEGIVYAATAEDLAGVELLPGNVRSALEAEYGVNVAPAEFAKRASMQISASRARAILESIGVSIPGAIGSVERADEVLRGTPRLTPQQIDMFIQRVWAGD